MTASAKVAAKPGTGGKRALARRKLTRPGKSKLQEIIGENQGRKSERGGHATQDRLQRVKPFTAGMKGR